LTWFMGLQFFELRLLRLPLEGFANNSSAYGFQMVLIAVAAIVANRLNMFEKMPHYFYGIMILLAVSIFYSYSRAGYFTYFIVLGLMVITTCQTFRRREIYAALVSGLAFISGYFMPYLI